MHIRKRSAGLYHVAQQGMRRFTFIDLAGRDDTLEAFQFADQPCVASHLGQKLVGRPQIKVGRKQFGRRLHNLADANSSELIARLRRRQENTFLERQGFVNRLAL